MPSIEVVERNGRWFVDSPLTRSIGKAGHLTEMAASLEARRLEQAYRCGWTDRGQTH